MPWPLFSRKVRGRLFDQRGANAISTDFRNHTNANDWTPFGANSGSLSIEKPGGVSNKCLRIDSPDDRSLFYMWMITDEISADAQETLWLLEYNGTATNNIAHMAAGSKCAPGSPVQYVLSGISRTTSGFSQRLSQASVSEVGASAFNWSVGTKYWIRTRLSSTRNLGRKIWADGTSEPGSFISFSHASNSWPATGRAGFYFRAGNAGGGFMRIHYASIAYASETAPSP